MVMQVKTYKNTLDMSTTPHLVKEKFPPLLFPEVHPLDCQLPPRVGLGGDADDTSRTLANLDEVGQRISGVTGGHHHLKEKQDQLAVSPLQKHSRFVPKKTQVAK